MAKEKILVVDDEQGIVALCERLLSRVGYEVLTADDPVLGMKIIEEEELDLLLVDIRMPKIDGFQLIEFGRIHQPDMGVVIMTGFGTLETAIRALREGADGLILKPFEKGKELVDTVANALEERQHKQEMARLSALRPLLDITEGLYSETREEPLLDLVINAICGHLRCDSAAIYQQFAGSNHLTQVAGKGILLPEEEIEMSGGILARSGMDRRSFRINRDGPGDKDLQVILNEYKLNSVMCIPIVRGGQFMIFYAGRSTETSVFQAADLDLFGILSRQADVALENARLYGELRDYVRQVEESQRALTQAEKMAAVGRLTASIAHEVNNPLQSVLNCLHLAEREELTQPERDDYFQLAKDELERLMQTVRRMLDFYRPGVLERKSTNIVEIVQIVLKLLEKQLEQQNIRVYNNFENNVPKVDVVSNQIQQVFFNIVLNAMDAMPTGGELTIEGGVSDKMIYLDFADTGVGISEDQFQNIFEPFVSTREGGSGLGLSVSYGILTAHGGSLEIIHGSKGGACFRVSLPFEEKK